MRKAFITRRVQSSAIRTISYNRRERTLTVKFHHGMKYKYFGVPTMLAYWLTGGEKSVGKVYNRYVKNRFPSVKYSGKF